jgi:predicted ATPase
LAGGCTWQKVKVTHPARTTLRAATQAQWRFQLVFRRFIGVFARHEHPLALFLDDLHWLDAATLDLIEIF